MFGLTGTNTLGETCDKLKERDGLIRDYMRTIRSRATSGAKAARKFKNIRTEDVVRDIMLPEFSFTMDFSFFQPARRFGPVQRKVGRRLS
jgi:hypothetical protein